MFNKALGGKGDIKTVDLPDDETKQEKTEVPEVEQTPEAKGKKQEKRGRPRKSEQTPEGVEKPPAKSRGRPRKDANEPEAEKTDKEEKGKNESGKKRKVEEAASTVEGEQQKDTNKSTKSSKRSKKEGPYTQYKGQSIPLSAPRIVPAAEKTGFKAICWNIGGLRAFLDKNMDRLKNLVKQEKPDCLGILEHKLQEGEHVETATKTLKEAFPEYTEIKFNCSTEKKGYSGVAALIHKDALHMIKGIEIEKEDTEGRVITIEHEKLYLVLCYVPNSGDGLKRLDERIKDWDPKLRKRLKTLEEKGKPVLLLGDLNVAHQDLDIWNVEAPHVPKSAGTTNEERDSFGVLLAEGFIDGFRHFNPDCAGAFSYWSVRAGNRSTNRGLRLDYAVASKALVAEATETRMVDAFHLPEFSPNGDHCPVGASISWDAGQLLPKASQNAEGSSLARKGSNPETSGSE
eukprot:gnl/MRDRNA2_/MRDRNA2_29416_c0_seq1.p1 gnl/MRDRNA2_/MRDRNA2_29416_c0~~gnl/MRDRNA2_/MRDRNA2_29416_c0_seq1.p1  ORF type:complete len:458 (-),score=125.64 gnl/MRDRNA2_/MRDRNA2_29416_c0_seq1:217-1590(-)